MGAAGKYLALDPRSPHHEITCHYNDPALSIHRIWIERVDGDLSAPIADGDVVQLHFIEANLFLEVKGKKVLGGSPFNVRLFCK